MSNESIRIRALKRKLIGGHRIMLKEIVNIIDTDICRYSVTDEVIIFKTISNKPLYELGWPATYGLFKTIEEAEEKYADIVSRYKNITLTTFKNANFLADEYPEFDRISAKEMFTPGEFKVDFINMEPTTTILLSTMVTAFDQTKYTAKISANFFKMQNIRISEDSISIDIIDSHDNTVIRYSTHLDVDYIKDKESKNYYINAIMLPDYTRYASFDRPCVSDDNFTKKYKVEPSILSSHIIKEALKTIISYYNHGVSKISE